MVTAAIYRGPKTGYVMTDEDVLWLARGFGAETGGGINREEAKWHFWCWMDRFHLWKGDWQGPTHVPLEGKFGERLVQFHSKGISPYWMTAGQGGCAVHPEDCNAAKLNYRAKWHNRTWEQLQSDGILKYALEAQAGTLERPTGKALYDFAACWLTAKQGRPCIGINASGQCFLPYDCLKANERASLVHNDDGSLPDAVTTGLTVKKLGISTLGVLFGVAVLWAAWTLYKKRKER